MPAKLQPIHAYIDETGDRGALKAGASPIFGMAAVLVEQGESQLLLQNAVRKLRSDFNVPDGDVMSWKRHVKVHDRRKHAAETLASVPNIQVLYAYSDKASLGPNSYGNKVDTFYNWVAGRMYKGIIWAGAHWRGRPRELLIRFGHVRGHDHNVTRNYLTETMPLAESRVRFDLVKGLKWVSADNFLESQAADLYGGFLKAMLWPTKTSWGTEVTEAVYLKTVWHQVRKGPNGCAIPLGFFPMPDYDVFTHRNDFFFINCPQKSRQSRTFGSQFT